jgi:long-chain-fatty-acid--CoA ligase ACSBG
MHVERNGKVLNWTWTEYQDEVINFAKAMHVIGVSERSAVNVMGHNAPEWVIGFLGGIFANCISTGVYISNMEEACLYQAQNSEAELILVDGIANLKKYEAILHKLPNVKAVVMYNVDKFPADVKDKRYYLWKDFLNLGKEVPNQIVEAKILKQRPGMVCVLVYTSGTTGNPKGVMLTHDNLIYGE